jgi:bifunctional UDP-N-acetylglucosamine pyrophosphorylase / glucosamine-1-phosphate N-acetyltransferase
MLVGPGEVGPGAYVAAGSVITDPVPPGAIGLGRARQRNVLDWVFKRRAGTKTADAARRAGAGGTMEEPSPPSSDEQQGDQP